MHDLAENKSCYASEWKKNVTRNLTPPKSLLLVFFNCSTFVGSAWSFFFFRGKLCSYCYHLQVKSIDSSTCTCNMEIVNVWINVNNNYISIKYRNITDVYIPYLNVVKERKTMNNHKDDWKLFEKLTFSVWIWQFQKGA